MKVVGIFALIAAIVVVAFSCSNEGDGFLARILRGNSGGSAVPVTVTNVVMREHSPTITVPAKLVPTERVEVSLPEEATIDAVMASDGDLVDVGDALFRISEENTITKLTGLRTDLKEAQAQLEKNSYFLRNRDRLRDEGRVDDTQYDNLESQVDEDEAAVERQQQEIARLEDRAGETTITATIAGVVSDSKAAPAATFDANAPIMAIEKVNPIEAEFRLAAYEATTVRPGMPIQIRFRELGGERAAGRITYVGTKLDPKTNTFDVRAQIPNPTGYYKVGLSGEVEFTSSKKQHFAIIPADALIRERRRYFIYTVIKGVAHRVQVFPNETRGNEIEITRGLREDDLIVVKGHDKLTEGSVVDIWGK